MRIITELARKDKKEKEDTFGRDDNDWKIYRSISIDDGETDSETEAEQIAQIETVLKQQDPNFILEGENGEKPVSIAEMYQLHYGTEQIRGPEVLFQPSMVGEDHCGISDTLEFILKQYPPEVVERIVQNVYITGGMSSIPGLKERVEIDLQSMLPFKSKFNITCAKNPVFDAWYGAKNFANNELNKQWFVTKDEYSENGPEYFKEHCASNIYFANVKKEPA